MPDAWPPPMIPDPGLRGFELAELEAAVAALERQTFARRLGGLMGRQIGFAGRMVSPMLRKSAAAVAEKALEGALKAALKSLKGRGAAFSDDLLHRRLAMVSGAVGGALGLASLPVELPLSTALMLRSIADIAHREGEDLSDPAAAFACLEVFALGGHAEEDNILEGGYLALRGLLAKSVSDAAAFVAGGASSREAGPVLSRLVGLIAERFGVTVSQKTAAQAMPVVGALSGAAVNLAFMEHFQSLARGHFVVRRLERRHGPALVRAEYARIARENGHWRGRNV